MSTRVRIEDHGHQDWLILGPEVKIPFRGTESEVVRAAKQVAAIMATAFFDVELDPVPRRMARSVERRPGRAQGTVHTVTVIRSGKPKKDVFAQRFTSTFSQLPGKMFGPFIYRKMVQDLSFSALLSPVAARNLVLEAFTQGQATTRAL